MKQVLAYFFYIQNTENILLNLSQPWLWLCHRCFGKTGF